MTALETEDYVKALYYSLDDDDGMTEKAYLSQINFLEQYGKNGASVASFVSNHVEATDGCFYVQTMSPADEALFLNEVAKLAWR